MSLYKYVANLSTANTTNEIILEVDSAGNAVRTLSLGGEAGELTYTQYLSLKDSFVLELEEKQEEVKPYSYDSPVVAKSKDTSVAGKATQS